MEHGKLKLRQTNCDRLSEHTHICTHTRTHTHTHYLCVVLRTRVILKGNEGVVRHDNGPTVPQVHVKPWLCPQENTTALSVCVITTNAIIQVHVKILKRKLSQNKMDFTTNTGTKHKTKLADRQIHFSMSLMFFLKILLWDYLDD